MSGDIWNRLTDKAEPTEDEINAFIGADGARRLAKLEAVLGESYELNKELRAPFGRRYGWGYKLRHKTAHLCYAFFESGTVTVTTQLSGSGVGKLEEMLPCMSPRTREYWKGRYPCGNSGGGWIHYRVDNDDELEDIIAIIKLKKKPSAR